MERSLQQGSGLQLSIAGFHGGSRDVDITIPAQNVPAIGAQFNGVITVTGTMRRVGNRIYVDVMVESPAELECDRSLTLYTEVIQRHVALVYEVDSDLALEQRDADLSEVEIRGIAPDRQWIDLTDDVRQELLLGLPMKRVAPEYRDQELTELYPSLLNGSSDASIPSDDRWDALRKLRGNQS